MSKPAPNVVPMAPDLDVPAMVRDAIARLNAGYVHAIDNDELERWPQFFVAQCFYQIITRTDFDAGRPLGVWYCDNRDMLEDRVSSIREVNVYEPHVYRHVLGPTEILGHENGAWKTQTGYFVVRTLHDGEMMLFSAGRYLDEVVVDGATAQFRKRLVITDSARYDTLLVIPL
jgi:anthranilate 1,2-dioxygenase small subunit